MTREHSIQNAILQRFGTIPSLRLWRANSGVAQFQDRTVRFGVNGQADLTGILPDGRRLEIEVKGPKGAQSPAQLNYARMIAKFNGLYILARSVEDVHTALIKAGYGAFLSGDGVGGDDAERQTSNAGCMANGSPSHPRRD